jgi:hypothetical protein
VYRLWNPVLNKIVRTRDVTFNEDELFDGNLDHLRDDLCHVKLDELSDLLTRLDQSNTRYTFLTDSDNENPIIGDFNGLDKEIAVVPESTENQDLSISQLQLPSLETELVNALKLKRINLIQPLPYRRQQVFWLVRYENLRMINLLTMVERILRCGRQLSMPGDSTNVSGQETRNQLIRQKSSD